MKVESTGSSIAIVNLTDWRDLYAYARLVKENKPFGDRVKGMDIDGIKLSVEFVPGRTEDVPKGMKEESLL